MNEIGGFKQVKPRRLIEGCRGFFLTIVYPDVIM